MKSVVLTIAAALVLIALPAVAQYSDPSTTAQPTTTTPTTNLDTTTTDTSTMPADTSTTTSDLAVEERTNPTAGTNSQNNGLTANGSVVSWNADEVVLRTATGITHFKLLPETTGIKTFTEGQRLTIDFNRNEQGVLLAQQIRLEAAAAVMPPGITTTGAAAAGSNVAEAVEEGVEETLGTDVDNDNAIGTRGDTSPDTASMTTDTTETSLPATGSKAPLAGLLGLLALGGAAALRRL